MSVSNRYSPPPTVDVHGCDRLYRALAECHRRIPAGLSREAACRHLNRSLAECLVAVACPQESDAVRSLCSSGGTALKRRQCQQAQLNLSTCLSSHQTEIWIRLVLIACNRSIAAWIISRDLNVHVWY